MEKLLGATSHSALSKIRTDMTKTHAALNKALGVEGKVPDSTDPTDPTFEPPPVNELRSDVHRADMLEEEEKRDSARARYERMYWESIPEDGSVSIRLQSWELLLMIGWFIGTYRPLCVADRPTTSGAEEAAERNQGKREVYGTTTTLEIEIPCPTKTPTIRCVKAKRFINQICGCWCPILGL